jgi:hypothetical protein
MRRTSGVYWLYVWVDLPGAEPRSLRCPAHSQVTIQNTLSRHHICWGKSWKKKSLPSVTATEYLSASQVGTVDLLCLVERVLYWLYCLYCEQNSIYRIWGFRTSWAWRCVIGWMVVKVLGSFAALGTAQTAMRRHMPDQNPQIHCRKNLNSLHNL